MSTDTRLTSTRARLAILALVLAAFALRVYRLDAQGLWVDEAWSHLIASLDWRGILDYSRQPFHHPPVYYILLHSWMSVAGDSEFAMRFMSLMFSVLIVMLLYRFARRWFAPSLARWTLLLAALSPFGVVYAQEARMYTVVLCVGIVALDFFLRWLTRGDTRAGLVYLALSLLTFATHYYSALLLLCADLYLLLYLWRERPAWTRRILWQWLAINGLIAVLLGAWVLLAAGPSAAVAEEFSHPLFEGRNLEELQRNLVFLVIGGIVYRPLSLPELALTAFLLAVVAFGAVQLWRAQQPHTLLLCLLLIVPPIVASPVPMNYNARYFFMSVPALVMLAAAALRWLQTQRAWLFAVGLMAVIAANGYGINFNYNFVKNAYREMAAWINSAARPDDALVLDGPHEEFLSAYYLRGGWAQQVVPTDADAAELVDIDGSLRALQQAHPRLWLIAQQSSAVDPADNTARWLSLNAYPVARRWYQYDDFVGLFVSGRADMPTRRWDAQVGDALWLEQAAVASRTLNSGDALAVRLTWHALKRIAPNERYLVTLRLFDAQGHVVQERVAPPCDGYCPLDDWVVGETVADHHGLVVPRDAPAGEYSLRLEVFAPRQQQSLPIKNAQTAFGTSLELARIQVTHGN